MYLTESSVLCYGLLVSELEGGRVHGDPNPVIGGLCPPPAPPPMNAIGEPIGLTTDGVRKNSKQRLVG